MQGQLGNTLVMTLNSLVLNYAEFYCNRCALCGFSPLVCVWGVCLVFCRLVSLFWVFSQDFVCSELMGRG